MDVEGAGIEIALPGGVVERARIYSSLYGKMFGAATPVRVGRFVLLERLGAGATGTVYAAHDPDLDRRVALKVLHGASRDAEMNARVDREARALARLRHPGVVTVYEVGTHGGDRFIAMDLVEGVTLRAWLEDGQPWARVLDVFVQAGRGLAAAHAAGLVHRDFKPDNVLVEQGHARVVDFGFARGPSTMPTDPLESDAEIDAVTRSGAVAGTPAYMAPEALQGVIDARSDQFSFCASLYEAIYGARPFTGATTAALLLAIERGRFTPPRTAVRIPRWLHRSIIRGLSADPAARWPSVLAWVHAVERRRGKLRRTAIIAALGGIAVGATVVLASGGSEPPCARTADALGEVWSEARQTAIGSAFERLERPHAREGWVRAEPAMQTWADAWIDARRDACEATHVRGEQSGQALDARMRCLDRHRAAFDAVASSFEHADDTVAAHAVEASLSLPRVADCSAEGVATRDDGPLAERAPEAMFATLARVDAAEWTGQYDAGLEIAQELASEALHGGHTRMAARAHVAMASIQERTADLAGAEASLWTALELSERGADHDTRVRAQVLLVGVLAQRREITRGEDWARVTAASVARLHDRARLEAALAANRGNLHQAAGRYEEALESRRAALHAWEQELDAEDPRLADAHYGIGTVLDHLGRLGEARAELQTALDLRRHALGEHHPLVARAHNALASVMIGQGELEDAVAELRRAIDIASVALGANHTFVAHAHVNLGTAIAQGRDPRSSISHFRRAIEIFESGDQPDEVAIATVAMNLARVLLFTGEARQAVPLLRRAEKAYGVALGPEHVDNAYVYNNLAAAYRELGEPDAALAAAVRGREIAGAALGDHPLTADAWLHSGESLRDLGETAASIEALEHTLSIHERIEARPAARAVVHDALARTLAVAGRHSDARIHIELARAGFLDEPTEHTDWMAGLDELEGTLR